MQNSLLIRGRGCIAVGLLAVCGCDLSPPASRQTATASEQTDTAQLTDTVWQSAARSAVAVSAGQLLLKEYPPLPSPPEHAVYVQLLKERCGVDYEVPKPPSGTSEAAFIAEVRAWNQVMESAIEQKFGAGILQTLRRDAAKTFSENSKAP
ncbi:MAG: hypothetical protein ACKO2P_16425 [Planctomycetota bacterium]